MTSPSVAIFIARRLLALGGLLVLLSFGTYCLVYLAPGSAEATLLGPEVGDPATIAAIREQYNLDDPFVVRYLDWARAAVQGDFGTSIRSNEPVMREIKARETVSIQLGLYAFVLLLLFGVPLGVLAALKQRRGVDRSIVGLSVFGVSAPAFATGILFIYVFSVQLGWFPTYGLGEGFVDRVYHLTLPAIALALGSLAVAIKLMRSSMIEVLDRDYVSFARARGVTRSRTLLVYGVRNALIPVVTAGGIVLGYMLTGVILVEVTFALPGVGSLLVESIAYHDVPMVQGLAMVFAVVIVTVNLIVDLLYLVIDPRIRFGKVAA